jgi:hypothetical protein
MKNIYFEIPDPLWGSPSPKWAKGDLNKYHIYLNHCDIFVLFLLVDME